MAHCSACVLQCPPGPHQTPAVWHTGWPPSQCGLHPYHSHAHAASPDGGREGGGKGGREGGGREGRGRGGGGGGGREWKEGGRKGGRAD